MPMFGRSRSRSMSLSSAGAGGEAVGEVGAAERARAAAPLRARGVELRQIGARASARCARGCGR